MVTSMRSIAIALAATCASAAFALNTSVPGSGLPTASDYSTSMLPERAGVVSWKTLAQVEPVKQGDRMVPEFSKAILALDRSDVKLQGFMIPLDIGDQQKHFLISAVPPHCQFCLPAGPEALVEVQAKTAIAYSIEPIVVSGRFAVVKDDPSGVLYRMSTAIVQR